VRLLMQIVLVALGSALGGLTRWGVTVGAARWFGERFPWGTLFINVSGSLFLGWFLTYFRNFGIAWLEPANLRLLVAVGFTGGYTTFSTFEYESSQLIRDGDGFAGTTYIFGSVFLGLAAVRLGVLLAVWMGARP